MQLNSKEKSLEAKGTYACPCGCMELEVSVPATAILRAEGKMTIQPIDMEHFILEEQPVRCSACGLTGKGYLFDRRLMTPEGMKHLIVRFIEDQEAKPAFVAALVRRVLGDQFTMEEVPTEPGHYCLGLATKENMAGQEKQDAKP